MKYIFYVFGHGGFFSLVETNNKWQSQGWEGTMSKIESREIDVGLHLQGTQFNTNVSIPVGPFFHFWLGFGLSCNGYFDMVRQDFVLTSF